MADKTKPGIMAFVETWLDASHGDGEVKIAGYSLWRRDRKREVNRGGVCAYVGDALRAREVTLQSGLGECSCENLWLEISCGVSKRLILGVIYRSPGGSLTHFCEHISAELSQLVDRGLPVMMVGDFNVDLLREDSACRMYRDCMESFFLEQIINGETRIAPTSRTLIDHIWVDDVQRVNDTKLQIGLSDHKICYVTMTLHYRDRKSGEFSGRSFRDFRAVDFIGDLSRTNWDDVLSIVLAEGDVDGCWERFTGRLCDVIDAHAPVKTFTRKEKNQPWMTNRIMELRRIRDGTKEIVEYGGGSEWRALLKRRKNEVDKEILAAKKNYCAGKINANIDNPTKLWKTIKDLAPSCFSGSAKVTLDGSRADEFNEFFTGVAERKRSEITTVEPEQESVYLESFRVTDAPTLDLLEITEEQTINTISKIPVSKATGMDGIPARILKLAVDVLSGPITKLINMVITQAIFPRCLKVAVVTPIHKKGNAEDPDNNRPISVLPILSKVVERIIKHQLVRHMTETNFLAKSQHGFRSSHSTSTCLLTLQDDLHRNLENKRMTGIVCLDLTKAFDMMDHKILAVKLQKCFGLGTATSLLLNYLRDRIQHVRLGNTLSAGKEVKYGVPQGAILGPLLFLVFINDLPDSVSKCNTLLFADDTTLYVGSRHACNIQSALNADLVAVKKWFDMNKLILNVSKTNFMMVRSRNHPEDSNVVIFVGNRRVKEVNEMKILGLKMDINLTYERHVRELSTNVKYRYRAYARIFKYLDHDTRIILYNSTIASRLNYCDVIWDSGNKNVQQRLQTIQNRVARRITNSGPMEYSAGLLRSLGWLDLRRKRALHSLVLMHKLLQGNGPEGLTQDLQGRVNKGTRTRGESKNNLIMILNRTNYGKKIFFNKWTATWNRIPSSIRETTNSQNFKEKLHQYLISHHDFLQG